ncbi:oxidoreductase [Escherichia coli]|nr:oxidoreductase [Escherichia coli]GDK61684.1 oxidoreductase [Escherichia coli]
MVINCAFIGFGKSTTRYHLPYVLNRKDSWHVAHIFRRHAKPGNDSNLLIVFYVQIMPDDFVMQLHRF